MRVTLQRVGRSPVLILVILATLLYSLLATQAAFHCDEFNAMRHVSDFADGKFSNPSRPGLFFFLLLPTLWLPTGLSKMLAARALMVLGTGLTLAMVARLARIDSRDSLGPVFALALLLGSGSFGSHAFEIRTDVLVLPCILGAAILLYRPLPSLRAHLLAGLLVASAGLFSQKSLYNAVALHGGLLAYIVASGAGHWRQRITRLLAMNGLTLSLILCYYVAMGALSGDSSNFASSNMNTAVSTAFGSSFSMALKWKWVKTNLSSSWFLYALLLPSLVFAGLRGRANPTTLALSVLSVILGSTVFIHRGFFLYYIASMEPYWAIVVGVAIAALLHRFTPSAPELRQRVAVLIVGLLFLPMLVHLPDLWTTSLSTQARLLKDIDDAFEKDTPYWDGLGMALGKRATSPFLTGTTRRKFRKSHPDGFLPRWKEDPPHFFVRNYFTRDRYLTPAERAYWAEHYVYYRPNLYLYGQRLPVDSLLNSELSFELLLTDSYTLQLPAIEGVELILDGKRVQDGAVLALQAGEHTALLRKEGAAIEASPAQEVRLLLGAQRSVEPGKLPERDYSMFPMLSRSRLQRYDDRKDLGDLLSVPSPRRFSQGSYRRRQEAHQAWRAKRDDAFREHFARTHAATRAPGTQQMKETAP